MTFGRYLYRSLAWNDGNRTFRPCTFSSLFGFCTKLYKLCHYQTNNSVLDINKESDKDDQEDGFPTFHDINIHEGLPGLVGQPPGTDVLALVDTGANDLDDILGASSSRLSAIAKLKKQNRRPASRQDYWQKRKGSEKDLLRPLGKSQGIPPSRFHSSSSKGIPSTSTKHLTTSSKSSSKSSKKSKKNSHQEDDTPRPNSQKGLFETLQTKKTQLRKQRNSSPTMVSTRDRPNTSAKNNNTTSPPGSPEENANPVVPETPRQNNKPGGKENEVGTDDADLADNSPQSDNKMDPDEAKFPGITALKTKIGNDLARSLLKDQKANAAERLKRLQYCRNRLSESMIQVYKLEKANEMVQKLVENIDYLKAELAKAKQNGNTDNQSSKKGPPMMLRMCNDHKDRAIFLTREVVWRMTKFVLGDNEVEDATSKVFDHMKLDPQIWDTDKKDSWVATYSKTVATALQERRNYLTQELKKLAEDLHKDGKKLPTSEELLACACRTSKDFDLMEWYWEKFLYKTLGKDLWGPSIRHYVPPTQVKNSFDKTMLTAATEAFAITVWQNNEEKWPQLFDWIDKNKGKSVPANLRNGRWTVTDGGQKSHASWKEEGLQEYVKNKKIIKAARQDPNDKKKFSKKFLHAEKKFLQELRKKLGLVCETKEEDDRLKKASRFVGLPLLCFCPKLMS